MITMQKSNNQAIKLLLSVILTVALFSSQSCQKIENELKTEPTVHAEKPEYFLLRPETEKAIRN